MQFRLVLSVLFAIAFTGTAFAQGNPLYQHPAGMITTQVVSCVPAQNYTHAPLMGPLSITFAPGMQIVPASLTDSTFVVMGRTIRWHCSSSLTYDSTSSTLTYVPIKPFFVGELVTAVATKKIMYDTAGQQMYLHGFAWQFYGMVTKQTRATFVDTEHLNESTASLAGFADMTGMGKIDMLFAHTPAAVIAYNKGDGINFQNTTLNQSGNMFPADYRLRGLMDLVVGATTCTYDSNQGNGTFHYGIKNPFNAQGQYNSAADLKNDGSIELITAANVQGTQGVFDSINVYSVENDSVIESQSIYLSGSAVIVTGDYNNDGAIDVAADISGTLYILYNDGTGNLLPPQLATSTTGAALAGTVAVDMDNDGLLDLVSPITGLGVLISHNNGDGTYTDFQSLNSGIPFSNQTVSFGFNVADCDGTV